MAVGAAVAIACSSGDPPTVSSTPPTTPTSGGSPTAQPSPIVGESVIDIAQTKAATTIYGADSGDFRNDLPLLTTGDVNGDGLADLLVGARFGDGQDNGRQDSGEAYLILGRADMPSTLDLAAGDQDVTLLGAEAGDHLGFFGALGDINGDGLDDILVSAPLAAPGGLVYVIFGAADLPFVIDLAAEDPDLLLIGPRSNSLFGDSVALTDVDGDGIDDIIIGATFTRRPQDRKNPGAQAGAAYVVFGGDHLAGQIDTNNGEQDVVLYGENSEPHPDEFGDTVLGADINADGIGDIIVTAEAADGPDNQRSVAAEVHVFFGSPEIASVLDVADGDADLTVWGAEQNDTIGFNLGSGDVNRDGVADLLITARGGDGPANSVSEGGETHIILGGADVPSEIDFLADEGDAVIYGESPADMLAYAIGVVSLNGVDNLVMAGSGLADGATDRRDSGVLYIFDAAGLTGETAVGDTALALKIVGSEAEDGAGAAATSGDLDGDGVAEIILLASQADGPDNSRDGAGEIYIVRQ